jgi:hypothetical protein
MLKEARRDAERDYAQLPTLRDELQTQYRQGEQACVLEDCEPAEILSQRLRGERKIFNAFNMHRLGQANWKCYKGFKVPENAADLLKMLGDDIDEDLESFPLRFQVVIKGFPSLTEDLHPIYQTADHAAYLSRDQAQSSNANGSQHGTAPATKSMTGRTVDNYDKLWDAPVPNLDFPTGCITLPELAAFHPEGIKSWHVIDRLCGNGGTQAAFAAMINHHRWMARGPITNNTVCVSMSSSMKKRAKIDARYAGWKSGNHAQLGNPPSFDPTSVSVTGFHTPANGKVTTSAHPVPIKDMATGVKIFPSGNDALDLTRAVQHCQANPDEVWMYPTDFARLVNHLGGPATVTAAHQDAAAIARYAPGRTATGISNTPRRNRPSNRRGRKADSDEEEELASSTGSEDSDSEPDFDSLDNKGKKRKFILDDSDEDDFDNTPSRKPPAKRPKIAPKPLGKRVPAPSRLRQQVEPKDIDSESDGELYQGPKKMEKVANVRRSGRQTKVTQTYVIHPGDMRDEEENRISSSSSSSSLSDHDSDVSDPEV